MSYQVLTMNRPALVISLLVLVGVAQRAAGHGDAIKIGETSGRLTVGHVANSFPPLVFGEDDADGLPEEDITSLPPPELETIIFWRLPGLEIRGLNDASSLSIEPRLRPVTGSPTNETRLVWFWNPATQLVEPSSADMFLIGTAPRFTILPAVDPGSAAPFLLANSLTGQQGFHNHGLLAYALDNDPSAPLGVYGFFARFVSNQYEPSEEFLIVFNSGAAFADMVPAAAAISAAATSLPGDFNHDGTVDAADYTVWRNDALGPEKYTEWKTHFGQLSGNQANGAGQGAGVVSAVVPELASLILMAGMWACGACVFTRIMRRESVCRPELPPGNRPRFACVDYNVG